MSSPRGPEEKTPNNQRLIITYRFLGHHQLLAGSSWTLRRSGAASGETINLIIARAASCSFDTGSSATLFGQGLFRNPGTGPT